MLRVSFCYKNLSYIKNGYFQKAWSRDQRFRNKDDDSQSSVYSWIIPKDNTPVRNIIGMSHKIQRTIHERFRTGYAHWYSAMQVLWTSKSCSLHAWKSWMLSCVLDYYIYVKLGLWQKDKLIMSTPYTYQCFVRW